MLLFCYIAVLVCLAFKLVILVLICNIIFGLYFVLYNNWQIHVPYSYSISYSEQNSAIIVFDVCHSAQSDFWSSHSLLSTATFKGSSPLSKYQGESWIWQKHVQRYVSPRKMVWVLFRKLYQQLLYQKNLTQNIKLWIHISKFNIYIFLYICLSLVYLCQHNIRLEEI